MGNNFHQQRITIAESLDRNSIVYHNNVCKDMDLTDYKFFYKVSDTRIMMVVRHGSGKNRNRYECVYYNGFIKDDTFVITDAEPTEAPIWFDDDSALESFVEKEGLTDKFSTFRNNVMPERKIDDAIPTLWEDFKDLKKERKKVGCWRTNLINIKTSKEYETEGDIGKNTTWKDYFEWLIKDIEAMEAGELKDIRITSVDYYGMINFCGSDV